MTPSTAQRTLRVLELLPPGEQSLTTGTRIIETDELQVVTACSREDFERQLRERQVDLLVADDRLPDCPLPQVLARMREHAPHAGSVAVCESVSAATAAYRSGARDCVVRNGSAGQVFEVVLVQAISRLRLSQELAAMVRQHDALLEMAREALCVLDCSLRFLTASSATRQLFELTPQELRGRSLTDLVPASEKQLARHHLAVLESTAQPVVFRTGALHPTPDRLWIEWRLRADQESDRIFAIAWNATRDIQAERMLLRRAEARARLLTLPEREHAVLERVTRAIPNKVIARQLSISVKTVERDRSRAMGRLNLQSLPEVVRLFALAAQDESEAG